MRTGLHVDLIVADSPARQNRQPLEANEAFRRKTVIERDHGVVTIKHFRRTHAARVGHEFIFDAGNRVEHGGKRRLQQALGIGFEIGGDADSERCLAHSVDAVQNEYLSANWRTRIVLAEVITPKFEGLRASELGAFQLG